MMMILQQHNSQQPHRRRTIFVPKKAVRAHTTIKQRLSWAQLKLLLKPKKSCRWAERAPARLGVAVAAAGARTHIGR